tara:strand:- start:199 stop:483 length:285 start_codon:yes stop_codon:yes gene_type:complete
MMVRYHNINGKKVQFTDAEETARDAEEKTWNDAASTRAWFSVRQKRNAKLAETDWMANSDVTMSDEWKTYRQALRDLPASGSDPDDLSWPTEPS